MLVLLEIHLIVKRKRYGFISHSVSFLYAFFYPDIIPCMLQYEIYLYMGVVIFVSFSFATRKRVNFKVI